MGRVLHSKATLRAALLKVVKQVMKRKGPGGWVGPVDLSEHLDDEHLSMMPAGHQVTIEDGVRRYVAKSHGEGRATFSRRFDADDPRAARLLEALDLPQAKAEE